VYNIGTLYSDLGSIAFGRLQDGTEVFVAGGYNNGLNGVDPEGVLQYCPNGINWSPQNPIGIRFSITDIAFGNGNFAALAGPNIITYDGISPYAINASEQYACIAYGNGIYVAAGQGIYTSTDTLSWTKVLETDKSFNRIIYGNGMFAAVGSGGALMTSSDGSNWSEWNTGVDADLFGAAFGNNSLVIVGEGGLIIQSGSLAVAPTIVVANDGAITEGAETNERTECYQNNLIRQLHSRL
jgi:hypothetical protein